RSFSKKGTCGAATARCARLCPCIEAQRAGTSAASTGAIPAKGCTARLPGKAPARGSPPVCAKKSCSTGAACARGAGSATRQHSLARAGAMDGRVGGGVGGAVLALSQRRDGEAARLRQFHPVEVDLGLGRGAVDEGGQPQV